MDGCTVRSSSSCPSETASALRSWAARDGGARLPGGLLDLLERGFSAELSTVRIHTSPSAGSKLDELQAVGAAVGEHILVHPSVAGQPTAARDWLIAHEVAHVLQQRAAGVSTRPVSPGVVADLEHEADAAATAVLSGRAAQLRLAGTPCPPVQFALPVLVPLLVAAGITFTAKTLGDGRPPRAKKAKPAPPQLHETAWGFVPIVGSADMMVNGDNLLLKSAGAAFFLLDCTLVGGVFVRGVFFTIKPAVQAGLRSATTSVRKRALREAQEGGLQLLSKKKAEKLATELTRGGTHALVGTEGAAHSVTWIVQNGQIYKLHGGVLKEAAKVSGREASEVVSGEWLRTTFTTVTHHSAKTGLKDSAVRETIEFWTQRAGVSAIQNTCRAGGCTYSQGMIMEGMALGTRSGRFSLPVGAELARMSGGPGTHFIVSKNIPKSVAGTFVQTAALTSSPIAPSVARQSISTMLVTPQESLELSLEPSLVPHMSQDNVDVYWPEDALVCR